jgi:hypothetical protein
MPQVRALTVAAHLKPGHGMMPHSALGATRSNDECLSTRSGSYLSVQFPLLDRVWPSMAVN